PRWEHHTGSDIEDEDERDERERTAPRQLLPILIRRICVLKNDERQRRGWAVGIDRPVLAPKCCEEQRGRLTSDACDAEEGSRNNSGSRTREGHAHDRL